MNRRTHVLIQIALLGAQALNLLAPQFHSPIAVGIIGFIQASVGIIAHSYNTDGTPQTTAFKETA